MNLEKLAKTSAFRAEMKEVFFEGMVAGYASNARKGTIAGLPGSKLVQPYIRGPWKVVDVYHVTSFSSVSGGTTIISYEGIPVWMMQYFGEYDAVAVPCLKAALRGAYSQRIFCGGRGGTQFRHNGLVYRNTVGKNHAFEDFSGLENIRNDHDDLFGWHTYQGGTMI